MMCFGPKQEVDPATQRNIEIERILRIDQVEASKQIKILLLGAGESGKSTVLKQMRLIHHNGFSQEEREQWRVIIFHNLVHAFQTALGEMLCHAREPQAERHAEARLQHDGIIDIAPIGRPQIILTETRNQKYIDLVMQDFDIQINESMPTRYLAAFTALWRDVDVQLVIQKGNEYALHDNLTYFCGNLPRLFSEDYVPIDQDILRARLRTTGISETLFDLGQFTYRMFDVGGQRSERRKWISIFDNVQVVLFLAAISGYDQVLVEDRKSNQMMEALKIFQEIANSRYFTRTSIILFLNKIDLFREKIESGESPVSKFFPDFKGEPTDVKASQEYFAGRFRQNAPPKKDTYIHYTNATDTDLLKRTMDSVQDMIIQQNLNKLIF